MKNLSLLEILTQFEGSNNVVPELPSTWAQGRALFGGLGAALASCAMRKLITEDSGPIRSMFITFVAPLPSKRLSVATKLLRQGSNVTLASAEVLSNDALCLQASAAYGRSRPTTAMLNANDINLPPRQKSVPPTRNAGVPDFLSHFSFDWSGNGIPFSGQQDRDLGIWVRHKNPLDRFPVESILSIADFPPPIVLAHYNKPNVPASSLTWAIDFVIPPDQIRTNIWFYLDYELDQAREGYSQQSGRIYTEDGRLCALSRQCMVYFEPKV